MSEQMFKDVSGGEGKWREEMELAHRGLHRLVVMVCYVATVAGSLSAPCVCSAFCLHFTKQGGVMCLLFCNKQ